MLHAALARGLLLFWAVWFSLVFSSNLADGMQHAGLLSPGWRFVSGNFALIRQSVDIYSLGSAVAAVLFAGVVLVQFATAALFWRAVLATGAAHRRTDAQILPFAPAIGLFAGFLIADELFVVYDRLAGMSTTHLLVFCGLLLSYLALRGASEDEIGD